MTTRAMVWRIGGSLVGALALTSFAARSEDVGRAEAVRRKLQDLRFEEALRTIDAWLAAPALPESDLAEALALRAQTHVALDELDAADEDYRSLLQIRPGYEPDRSLTPPKALARFEALKASLVGWIRLRLAPPDAILTVDQRPAGSDADGRLALWAGERLLRAERRGYDPAEVRVAVAPGTSAEVEMVLTPNSRTVVVRTEPEGVSIRVDGVLAGETARPGGAPGEPAELSVENLALGEHVFELSKPCFRPVRIDDLVSVDLLGWAPKELGPIALAHARARIALRGIPTPAEVRVDGAHWGGPPGSPLDLCAGERLLEVIRGGRRIWVARVALEEGEVRTVQVEARPNVAWIGSEGGAWEVPDPLRGFSEVARLDPPAGLDLGSAAGWDALGLPADLDLAVQPVGGGRWLLYSPHLGTVDRLEVLPPLESPRWQRNGARLRLADTELYGSARVVDVVPGDEGQAACVLPGDRVLGVATTELRSAADVLDAIAALPPGTAFELRVESPSRVVRRVTCEGRASPVIRSAGPEPGSAAVRAAWAAAAAAVGSDGEAASAQANLAIALSEAGRHEAAASLWRRLRWHERSGIGEGTRLYYLARELQALGEEDAAREAYLGARGTQATAGDDDGPEVGPAAADHLMDLGVSVEEEE